MVFSPLQKEKASPPMYVTLLGMVTEVRLLHSEKAAMPMDVTPLPMIKEVKLLQP